MSRCGIETILPGPELRLYRFIKPQVTDTRIKPANQIFLSPKMLPKVILCLSKKI